MICPKCHANTAREVHIIGQADSLTRQDGISSAGYITGISCLCGYWRDVEVVPTMERPDITKQPYNPAGKTVTFPVVMRFYDSIAQQRKEGVSWYSIARLLCQAGHSCQEKTLQKYFMLEHDKRCGDGKAA